MKDRADADILVGSIVVFPMREHVGGQYRQTIGKGVVVEDTGKTILVELQVPDWISCVGGRTPLSPPPVHRVRQPEFQALVIG